MEGFWGGLQSYMGPTSCPLTPEALFHTGCTTSGKKKKPIRNALVSGHTITISQDVVEKEQLASSVNRAFTVPCDLSRGHGIKTGSKAIQGRFSALPFCESEG